MAGCSIDESSPHFQQLREHWKKHGYRSIDTDLEDAFTNIRKDIHANQWKHVARFSAVLSFVREGVRYDYRLYKYRQKNRAAREGARGGWRIYAVFDPRKSILYPVVVFPKKEMEDASDDTINEAVEALLKVFQANLFTEPQ